MLSRVRHRWSILWAATKQQDITLPIIPLIRNDTTDPSHALDVALLEPFSINKLAAIIQSTCNFHDIEGYLEIHTRDEVTPAVTGELVEGEYPIIFFVLQRGCERTLRVLLTYGGCGAIVNGTSKTLKVPALAFAVLHGHKARFNMLLLIKIMLAHGAESRAIPQELWIEFIRRPRGDTPPSKTGVKDEEERKKERAVSNWCLASFQKDLCKALDLSERYFLWKAYRQNFKPATHASVIMKAHPLKGLLEPLYHLVGQSTAIKMVIKCIFSYISSQKMLPSIMMFTGPNGHSQEELASYVGIALLLKYIVIDCSTMQNEQDLLGADYRSNKCQIGSQLNNFLAEQDGLRSIVLLEGLETSTPAVFNRLFHLTGLGTFTDRRNDKNVDCSNAIFILTAHAGDEAICEFFENEMGSTGEEEQTSCDMRPLQHEIRSQLLSTFGAPLISRVDAIIPFFPFTLEEQAVIAHQYILELTTKLRQPVNFATHHAVGHIDVVLHGEEEIAGEIARTAYEREVGVESIRDAVSSLIELPVVAIWESMYKDLGEGVNQGPLVKFIVKQIADPPGPKRTVVFLEGHVPVS